jgi:hypothetical protein
MNIDLAGPMDHDLGLALEKLDLSRNGQVLPRKFFGLQREKNMDFFMIKI